MLCAGTVEPAQSIGLKGPKQLWEGGEHPQHWQQGAVKSQAMSCLAQAASIRNQCSHNMDYHLEPFVP